MFQVIAKGLTLRPFGFATTQEQGSFAADCGGWDDAKASVDFYFLATKLPSINCMYHPSWKQLLGASIRQGWIAALFSSGTMRGARQHGFYTFERVSRMFQRHWLFLWILEDFLARTVGSRAGTGRSNLLEDSACIIWARQLISGLRSF